MAEPGVRQKFPLRVLWILIALGAIGAAGILPYLEALYAPLLVEQGLARGTFRAAALAQGLLLSALLSFLGLLLARRTGLGTPIFTRLAYGGPAVPVARPLAVSALLGLAVGACILLADKTVFAAALTDAALARPVWWKGLLAGLYGGIVEEILFRLFAVNLVVWVLMRIGKRRSAESAPARPSPASWQVWTGIALSALGFAAGHLPTGAALTDMSGLFVLRVLVLNSVPGLLFGHLFRRHGLAAAMTSHFFGDVAVHVIGAL